MLTSVSDNNQYPQFCYLASWNDEVFQTFRQSPIYQYVLEHVNPQHGAEYLKIVLDNPKLDLTFEEWQKMLLNDCVGTHGKISERNWKDFRICRTYVRFFIERKQSRMKTNPRM